MNQSKAIFAIIVQQKWKKRPHSWLIAILATVAFSLTASANVFDPFTQAHGRYVWGDYILAGNSVMRCITSADPDARDVNNNGNTTEALGPLLGWIHYAACLADSQQTTNPAAFDPVPNDQRWMVFNNTDTTTSGIFNSSEATFSIPPGADITFARLYWSGNRAEAVNDGTVNPTTQVPLLQANGQQGTAASPWYSCNAASATFDWTTYGSASTLTNGAIVSRRQVAARRLDGQLNQMRIRVNGSAYQTVTADEGPYFGVQNFGGVYYASQADVTSYMQQQLDANEVAGVPTQLAVTGANIASGQGFNCHGGWNLAVVYEYPARNATYAPDLRYVEIFDGMAEAVSSTTGPGDPGNPDEVNLAMSQFTSASGVVEPRFGLVAYEGDQGLVNDQMQFEFGEPMQTNVVEPKTGRTDNYFSSTIGDYSNFSTGFDPQLTRNPSWANNDGVDSKVDGLSPSILTNSGANLNVRIFTSGDRFVVQVVTFSAVVASISGTVYEDNNNNGQQNAGEAGISNVTLTLTGTDSSGAPVNMTTTTDANGDYTFVNVPPSNGAGYTITETHPAGYVDGQDAPGTVGGSTVGASQEPDKIVSIVFDPTVGSGFDYDFGEIVSAQLSGTVCINVNDDGLCDANEPPIEGVTITLDDGDSNTPPLVTATDDTGYYEFIDLLPGNYTVTETQPAGYNSVNDADGGTDNVIAATVQAGDNIVDQDFYRGTAARQPKRFCVR
ncbi:MAG: SdrD B-like domain-containing protein [Caldilineaceae bacterium]